MATQSEIGAYVGLALILTFIVLSTLLLLIRSNKEPIRSRAFYLVLFSIASMIVIITVVTFSNILNVIDCVTSTAIVTALQPFLLLPYVVRCVILYSKYAWNIKKLRSKEENQKDWWFSKYKYLSNEWIGIAVCVVACLVNVIISIGISRRWRTLDHSNGDICLIQPLVIVRLIWAIVGLLAAVICIIKLWKVEDAYGFKVELKIFVCIVPIVLVIFVIFYTIIPNYSRVAVSLNIYLAGFTLTCVSCLYPIYLTFSRQWASFRGSFDSKSSMGALSPLRLCLAHPSMIEDFKLFCVKLWCVENVNFFLEVESFRLINDPDMINKAIQSIMSEYIMEDSPQSINIDMNIRVKLTDAVRNKTYDGSIFDEAQELIYYQIKSDTFIKYKLSGDLEKSMKKAGVSANDDNATLSSAAIELLGKSS